MEVVYWLILLILAFSLLRRWPNKDLSPKRKENGWVPTGSLPSPWPLPRSPQRSSAASIGSSSHAAAGLGAAEEERRPPLDTERED